MCNYYRITQESGATHKISADFSERESNHIKYKWNQVLNLWSMLYAPSTILDSIKIIQMSIGAIDVSNKY